MYAFISHYLQFVCVNVLIFSGALDCMCFVLQSFCVRVVLSEIIHFFFLGQVSHFECEPQKMLWSSFVQLEHHLPERKGGSRHQKLN